MQDVCRETSSYSVADVMPGDRMESYLDRIEQYLVRSALAINNNNQTRGAATRHQSFRIDKETKAYCQLIGA